MSRASNSELLGGRTDSGKSQTAAESLRVARAAPVVAIVAFLIAVGTAVAIIGVAPTSLVAVASLAAIPMILWASVKAPGLVVATIVFSQILEGLQVATPVGTISLAIISLIVFLVQRLPHVVTTAISPGYRLGTVCLAAYVFGHGFQFLHGDAGLAARQMITASSFAAFVVLGMYIGTRRSHLAAAAVGAAIALLVLATLALAANLGIGPFLTPRSPAREILGVTSPFFRSYGLEGVPVGLLLPLCVPWLAMTTRLPSGLWVRVASRTVLALISLASLLLFQSRSMVLEVVVGMVLAWSLANRRFSTGVLVVGFCSGAVLVTGLALSMGTDVVSNQLRTESYATALDYLIRTPSVLLLGTNPEHFRLMVNATLTYGSLIPAGAPTHNLLIETVVSGGIVSGTGLVVLVLAPILSMFRWARRVGQFSNDTALALSGVAIAVIEASVTPAIANSAPFWMALGWAVAVAAGASRVSERHIVVAEYRYARGLDRRPAL